MKAVIKCDIYCSKMFLTVHIVFSLACAAFYCVGMPPFMGVYASALPNFLIFQKVVTGESCGWERYLDMSGIDRREQVAARFLESLALNLFTAVIYSSAMAINTLFVREENILSAAEIFMYVSLDVMICAVLSVLIAVYYVFPDKRVRHPIYFIAFFILMTLPMTVTSREELKFLNNIYSGFEVKNAVLYGAVFLVLTAALYAAFYLVSLARFRKKEI